MRVDRQHAPGQQFEQAVGHPEHLRQQGWPQAGNPRRLNAGRFHRRERLVDLTGQNQPPAPIGQFGCQGQVRQRHQRVVQIHQQLAPQHGLHVATGLDRKTFDTKQMDQAGIAVFDHHLAVAGAVNAQRQFAIRGLHDIERHHAGQHCLPGKPGAQPFCIFDAILQAHHNRIRAGMDLDEACHILRRAALDRDQDHIRLRQGGGRIGGDCKRLRLDRAIAAFKIGNPQSALPQRRIDTRPGQQNHPAPGERQAAAGIAMTILLSRSAILSPARVAAIRHENHNIGGIASHEAGPHVWP
ncbi:hypothetical protein X743_25160 [Mesorhizobium sp. LNHC252B00]|nr:hypothetical protein X743_25160 [Mesorhizobium sp. LNHC252B00]